MRKLVIIGASIIVILAAAIYFYRPAYTPLPAPLPLPPEINLPNNNSASKETPIEYNENKPLIGHWRLVAFNNSSASGAITFKPEGKINGRFCNSIFGSYSIANNVISMPALASTKMYCEGKMDVELSFVTSAKTMTYTVTKEALILSGSGNTFVFSRI